MTHKSSTHCRLVPKEERIFWACEVKDHPEKGKGLFAGESIPKGAVFAIDGGIVYDAPLKFKNQNYGVLVDEGKYLYTPDMSRPTPLCFLNHSCDPNLARFGGLVFMTKRRVPAGQELTVDYAPLIAGLKKWELPCACGSANCRKIITSTDWKDARIARRLWPEWLPYIQKRLGCR